MSSTVTLTATLIDDIITVTDADGGVWWPNAETLADILTNEDPATYAIAVCIISPYRGEWKQ